MPFSPPLNRFLPFQEKKLKTGSSASGLVHNQMNFRSWQHSYTWCPVPAKNHGTRHKLKWWLAYLHLRQAQRKQTPGSDPSMPQNELTLPLPMKKGAMPAAQLEKRTFVLKESLQQFISLLSLTKKQNTSMRRWPKRSCSKGTAALVLWSVCSHLNFTFRMAGIFCFADICKETFYQKTLEFFNKITSASLKCFEKRKKKKSST